MKRKVSSIIISHLSDVQEEVGIMNRLPLINNRCNWIKWLVMTYPDTNTEIFEDVEYADFVSRFPQWAIPA